ncbi:UDP-N-acetylglucosamine--N-acetylmuramyl-(pentapeptide) pyrophosphoryl-undecaprenol N-acetylglucosamine transferase 2 [Paenibacillus sp. J31TS4]|uniref:undecaprenyldiphospho-muramoylpentapeptide beta-N-acetylglucosaminyltransferase n=1 Tax=Paenibacillus sp. J31TS4 TaxID=2807195 RepID=UPI001B1F47AE|nr:undecaprenyldiphospho-muramoylpentapeptide beta-N-acetylglucosaminyltransferase [Paenibacillus sp. J31TS4]GIP36929.1 UDP-N-acetylglucosamine--N-acetylmuramyl-(pentapeptide) pyrophosphoryl-undecaprenol N-acetylglucosamine transferase 2 [Paenibacillus sp. J31TS4]
MKKIVFTGGGSAGHVSVNLALIPLFQQLGWETAYIGSHQGIERGLIRPLSDVPYYGIASGKLRRYLDWNNVKDPFKVVQGTWQAYRLLGRLRPDVVFSKGGFVSVPVVAAARARSIPVVIHESDVTPGLANRIASRFAKRICVTFPETAEHWPDGKAVYAGAVVREELRQGVASRGYAFCGFRPGKPVLLIMGGSLGAASINRVIRNSLQELLPHYQIVHLCGEGQEVPELAAEGYRQYPFLREELPDVLTMTELVVSRAGANSIFEFLALRKPMLLIPLSRKQSRGDQIINAQSFLKRGFCEVLEEEELSKTAFLAKLRTLNDHRREYLAAMETSERTDAAQTILRVILEESDKE